MASRSRLGAWGEAARATVGRYPSLDHLGICNRLALAGRAGKMAVGRCHFTQGVPAGRGRCLERRHAPRARRPAGNASPARDMEAMAEAEASLLLGVSAQIRFGVWRYVARLGRRALRRALEEGPASSGTWSLPSTLRFSSSSSDDGRRSYWLSEEHVPLAGSAPRRGEASSSLCSAGGLC